MVRGVPPPVRRRVEGYRWLRSDGKPNWSQRVSKRPGDAYIVSSKPPVTVSKTTNVMEATEIIYAKRVRGLAVVIHPSKLFGIATTVTLVNYLGGGSLYSIIENRFEHKLYPALQDIPMEDITIKDPVTVNASDRLEDVLYTMVDKGAGFIPVVDEDGNVVGIITEHDLVKHLREKKVGVTVAEVMSKYVIGVKSSQELIDAMKLMAEYGFRRLVVFGDNDKLEGMITAKDIVYLIGSHRVFEYVKSGDVRDLHSIPVKDVYSPVYYPVHPMDDVGDVATIMVKHGISGLPVIEDNEVVGIVTERDILYALATR